MKVNIIDLKQKGEIALDKIFENIDFIEEDALKKLNIKVKLKFIPKDLVIAEGVLFADIDKTCEKCLENYICKIKIPFYKEYFLEDLPLSQDDIDLKEVIREEFWLNVPITYRCSSDCKGLCSGCGANLNIEKCKCKIKKDDDNYKQNPFSVLKKLKK